MGPKGTKNNNYITNMSSAEAKRLFFAPSKLKSLLFGIYFSCDLWICWEKKMLLSWKHSVKTTRAYLPGAENKMEQDHFGQTPSKWLLIRLDCVPDTGAPWRRGLSFSPLRSPAAVIWWPDPLTHREKPVLVRIMILIKETLTPH